jgi:hypothetical protein
MAAEGLPGKRDATDAQCFAQEFELRQKPGWNR